MSAREASRIVVRASGVGTSTQPAGVDSTITTRGQQVYSAQVHAAYESLPGTMVAAVAGGLLLAFGMHAGRPPTSTIVWLAALLMVVLGVSLLCRWYRRASPPASEAALWARRLVLGAFVSGCLWGSAGIVLFVDDVFRQVLLSLVMFLVAMSGFIATAAILPSVYAFVLPVLLPITVRFALAGKFEYGMLAAGMAVVLLLMLYYSHKLNRVLVYSFDMRFENRDLNEALTEQRVRERTRVLELANQHKSEFLASMSHELRTPLNAIIGFSEVLKEKLFGELNTKQAEYVEDIHGSGHHLLALINDILDLSKIEAGRMELTPSEFALPAAIHGAVTFVRARAARHAIHLEVSADAAVGQVVADERKVRQVLLNLLSNAVKFTPDGGRIEVRARLQDSSAEVSVSDTGIGIPAEHLDAVFEEFRQVGGHSLQKGEGTGLGLALARKFVELHGGRIWVESTPGQGSTFTFTLPIHP